jgi:hypothetical protein
MCCERSKVAVITSVLHLQCSPAVVYKAGQLQLLLLRETGCLQKGYIK